jgi:hypothetical protein
MILDLYTPEYVRDEIARAQREFGAAYFPGAFPDVPNWEDFIRYLNSRRQIPADFVINNPEEEILKGHVFKRTDADYYFYAAGGNLEEEFVQSAYVAKVLSEITGDILNGGPRPIGTFLNFAAEGFKVPAHGDNRETIFWQCIGTSTWTVATPRENGAKSEHIMTIDMKPGDILYVGHWVQHSIEVTEPRAGIAFNAKM